MDVRDALKALHAFVEESSTAREATDAVIAAKDAALVAKDAAISSLQERLEKTEHQLTAARAKLRKLRAALIDDDSLAPGDRAESEAAAPASGIPSKRSRGAAGAGTPSVVASGGEESSAAAGGSGASGSGAGDEDAAAEASSKRSRKAKAEERASASAASPSPAAVSAGDGGYDALAATVAGVGTASQPVAPPSAPRAAAGGGGESSARAEKSGSVARAPAAPLDSSVSLDAQLPFLMSWRDELSPAHRYDPGPAADALLFRVMPDAGSLVASEGRLPDSFRVHIGRNDGLRMTDVKLSRKQALLEVRQPVALSAALAAALRELPAGPSGLPHYGCFSAAGAATVVQNIGVNPIALQRAMPEDGSGAFMVEEADGSIAHIPLASLEPSAFGRDLRMSPIRRVVLAHGDAIVFQTIEEDGVLKPRPGYIFIFKQAL